MQLDKLKKLLNERMLTKNELCKRSKISRPTLDNLLNNGKYTPSLKTLESVCKALCVDTKDYI